MSSCSNAKPQTAPREARRASSSRGQGAGRGDHLRPSAHAPRRGAAPRAARPRAVGAGARFRVRFSHARVHSHRAQASSPLALAAPSSDGARDEEKSRRSLALARFACDRRIGGCCPLCPLSRLPRRAPAEPGPRPVRRSEPPARTPSRTPLLLRSPAGSRLSVSRVVESALLDALRPVRRTTGTDDAARRPGPTLA